MKDSKPTLLTLLLVSLLVTFSACQSTEEQPEPAAEAPRQAEDAPEAAAVKRLNDAAVAAVNAGDATALASLHTDDAVFMQSNAPAALGKQAIGSRYGAFFSQSTVKLSDEVSEVEVAGDWAFARGAYTIAVTSKDEPEPAQHSGKWLAIAKREPGGGWKIHRRIANSDEPPAAAEEESKAETAEKLSREVTQLRRQIGRLRASQAPDASQRRLIQDLRGRLSDQERQIERLREERCRNCTPPRPARGIYLWDGSPPEPVELPFRQARR